jgi:hypothetical protein
MTKPRFATRWACAVIPVLACGLSQASAQQAQAKAGKLINVGDILSGELTAMSVRGANGRRVATYQITSEPRRLPPPGGACNLETGPETSSWSSPATPRPRS